ncbi:M15 family metallopeptidase [Bacillus cereus]|uniref:D-alanyl-D-alanine carboxypeptidase family protein n=4 Tax=Bacillus cereus group TaxID=86661 RepID=A0AAN0SWH5_BACCE|nr:MULTISPECIES: M15 family metallopeptidase [Bacillus cereus group]ABK85570.1 D-Ala-D-Ala carboxypeptidase, Metallo peptidase, MEROPS family M15B [Bacillus thuringiensis str. Al Hakam]ACO31228.1 serine-type D-Ala-D-Ala carboxypeptidase [Bacillus cereus 03BB102]AEW55653.1 D-alanyl-D-alanine carboxypeptidase [Bacillus cereus F837/76]AJG55107.1 D-alanyl-D-alanine carboxypeptidase family protein [Bacillus cereus 03BB102]AJH68029.1 D-alanyl-D-alanine carboxypeptidase family protein [Bacillus thuri
MRIKLVGIFTCMIVIVGIFIVYTNQSIGKEPIKTNYETRENSINRERNGTSNNIASSFASVQAVVNKEYGLPEDYKPEDLVVPNVPFSFSGTLEKSYLRKEAAEALERLFNLAKKEGIQLNAVSGFRSYDYQKKLYANNVKRKGQEHTDRFSAKPGHSEHQTGLTMDVSSKSANNELELTFANTKEGKWLKENAHRAGFIIRYPKGKESITGYAYEPWHIRYVGDIAESIYKKKLTLEEYMNL